VLKLFQFTGKTEVAITRVNEAGRCGPTYKYGSKMVRVLKHGPAIEKTIQRKRGEARRL
jgi:hypothetical protein